MKPRLTRMLSAAAFTAFAACATLALPAGARQPAATADSAPAATLAQGEVLSVSAKHQLIKLKHGPIRSRTVEMTPMTMSFPVAREVPLADVKVGDKVLFDVENVKGTAIVTVLRVVR